MHIKHKDATIFYTDQGSGPTVLLLHGFLENKEMWSPLIPALSTTHRVISIDLLGHGKSECIGYVHTMELFADTISAILHHLDIYQVSIIGHSMGGYVGLAFAKAYPKKINKLCLLNSTPYSDSPKRIQTRTRANGMAKKNYSQLIRLSVMNLFDPLSKQQYRDEIETTIAEALKTPVQGYLAANSGMMLRKNSLDFWKNTSIKTGLILGSNDTLIDAKKHLHIFANHTDHMAVLNGGHMIHISNTSDTRKELLKFIND